MNLSDRVRRMDAGDLRLGQIDGIPVDLFESGDGKTPGFAVVSIPERKMIKLVQPAEGNEKSDFHGIGVRMIK